MRRGPTLEPVYWLDGELICCARRFRNRERLDAWAATFWPLPPLPHPAWIWWPFDGLMPHGVRYAPRACSDTTSSTTSP